MRKQEEDGGQRRDSTWLIPFKPSLLKWISSYKRPSHNGSTQYQVRTISESLEQNCLGSNPAKVNQREAFAGSVIPLDPEFVNA